MEQDKINAYMTLYTALVETAKAAAPMIPFMTEQIYRNLVCSIDASAPESVHLCDFPSVRKEWIDPALEVDMAHVLKSVVMGRACRNAANIKNRQPVAKMLIKAEFTLNDFYKEIIEDELNVKSVEFTDDVRGFTTYIIKPQLKTVGPKYGKFLGGIREYLSQVDGNAAMDDLKSSGALKFTVNDTGIELTEEDLLIEMTQQEGFETLSEGSVTVVIDTKLTPELIEEGFVREIVSKVQTMRKEAGFEVMDRITVFAKDNEKIAQILEKCGDTISREVIADDIKIGEMGGYTKEWNINGETVTLGVKKQ